jgi:tRNA1Val (adenine37-N6)-methyltransferase
VPVAVGKILIMPNPYFRFKHFTIQQDQCIMKVCTDSCILGAWTVLRLCGAAKILDIGTGTGLLPLMLAQKSGARIDSIESDAESARQARENFLQSPWADRIIGMEGDVRKFSFHSVYDFVITNPPFYESDLRSPELKKNKAKHADTLTLDELITVIQSRLSAKGAFSILLPFLRTNYFENLAFVNGFFLHEKLIIRQTPKHVPFRAIGIYKRNHCGNILLSELTIKDKDGKYSEDFSDLMKAYY